MTKVQKTRLINAPQSSKIVWVMIFIMAFLVILPSVSAVGNYTNSTYVAGTGEAITYLGLNAILIIFLVGCFFTFLYYENLIARALSFGLGYLLVIAISFVAWNMANDFLTSPFLSEMFRIIFLVLVIGAFPLLLGAFAWYFIMLFKVKEIEGLMKHGMSVDEAQERVRRRR